MYTHTYLHIFKLLLVLPREYIVTGLHRGKQSNICSLCFIELTVQVGKSKVGGEGGCLMSN